MILNQVDISILKPLLKRRVNNSNLEGERIEKIIIPSNKIDIYSRVEVLLGLKLSGHTNTLTEASNLIDEIHKIGEIQNEQQYRIALDRISASKMELAHKLLKQFAHKARPKREEHMLIVMDKSTHEEHLSQPLQTNIKQFKIALTFLTVYNGIFKVRNSKNTFYFKKTFTDGDDFIQITLKPRAYEIEGLNNEIKMIFIDEGHYTESGYPFEIKPNFSTLGSIIEISPQRPIISFVFEDSIGNLVGFHETIL